MKLETFSSLVASLYDAALDPSEWPRVAKQSARAFESDSCCMFRLDLSHGTADLLGITENFDAQAIADYEAYYHQKDVWAIAMSKSGTGRAMLSSELVGATEFLNSEIFDGYAKRVGLFEGVVSVFPLEPQCMGAIGIHRPHGSRAFDVNDKRMLARLLPHVSRAMLLQRRLHGLTQDRQLALDALESLSVGMIAVDAQASVLFANSTAERLLSAGLGLTYHQGCLGAADPGKEDELRRLIRQAGLSSFGRSSEPGGVIALPRPAGRPFSVMICPLRPQALPAGPSIPAALLIFGDPDAALGTAIQALTEIYGLTPAEARLMAALVDGERLEDYADRLQISIHTARTQSKQIFAKTGHGRQADLVREVLANPALRAKIRTPDMR